MSTELKQAAVFLDRDGTLIRDVAYLSSEEQIDILPRVPDAIRLLREKGLKVIVVTNQSGVARGRLTEEKLVAIHEALRERLARCGAELDGIYYCPHHPTEGVGAYKVACDCRKPNTGLVQRAAQEFQLDPSTCYVVGDQMTDMELSKRIGATGVWIRSHEPRDLNGLDCCHVVRDLMQAAQWIVSKRCVQA